MWNLRSVSKIDGFCIKQSIISRCGHWTMFDFHWIQLEPKWICFQAVMNNQSLLNRYFINWTNIMLFLYSMGLHKWSFVCTDLWGTALNRFGIELFMSFILYFISTNLRKKNAMQYLRLFTFCSNHCMIVYIYRKFSGINALVFEYPRMNPHSNLIFYENFWFLNFHQIT